MLDFILAIALICPSANKVSVTEVLTTKPISYQDCDKRVEMEKYRKLIPQDKQKEGCELDLICVRVHWEE